MLSFLLNSGGAADDFINQMKTVVNLTKINKYTDLQKKPHNLGMDILTLNGTTVRIKN